MTDSSVTDYFAYGSLMDPVQRKQVTGLEDVKPKPACLRGYRLAFTRRSRTWSSQAADVVLDERCCVWGLLFRVTHGSLDALRKREGLGKAYELCFVKVETQEGDEVRAATSIVKEKEQGPLPSPKYLETLVRGAQDGSLPTDYVAFLSVLKREAETREDWTSYLVSYPTSLRSRARGNNLMILNAETARDLRVGTFAIASLGERACLARVARSKRVETNACEVDQSIRESLGLPGLSSFGPPIRVHPLRSLGWFTAIHTRPRIVSSRSLVLSIRKSAKSDAEKNIVVLHPRNIALLGLTEGEYARLMVVVEEEEEWRLRVLTRRVYGGTAPVIHPDGAHPEKYPKVEFCYLDRDGRIQLFGEDSDGDYYPVVVRPSASKLFSRRILFYGLSLFLGIEAFYLLLENRIVSLTAALVLTCIAAFVDLRSRLRY